MLKWTPYALATYSNEEVIAVNQDPLGVAAVRLAGEDLTWPCTEPGGASYRNQMFDVQAAACDGHDRMQQWSLNDDGTISLKGNRSAVLDLLDCGTDRGTSVAVYFRHTADAGGCMDGLNQILDTAPLLAGHAAALISNLSKPTGSPLCLEIFDGASAKASLPDSSALLWDCHASEPRRQRAVDMTQTLASCYPPGTNQALEPRGQGSVSPRSWPSHPS